MVGMEGTDQKPPTVRNKAVCRQKRGKTRRLMPDAEHPDPAVHSRLLADKEAILRSMGRCVYCGIDARVGLPAVSQR